MKLKTKEVITLIALPVVFVLIYTYVFDNKVDLGGDNAYYYALGNALADGKGYMLPMSVSGTPYNHFPPGYPAIMSVFLHISDSITFIKAVNGGFLLGSIILIFFIARRFFENNYWGTLLTVIFTMLNTHLLRYGFIMMSEVPYMFFMLLCIYLFLRTDHDKSFLKNPFFYGVLFTLVGLIYIRTTGVALFVAIVAFMLFSRKWLYAAAYFIGTILLLLPWQIRSASLGGSSYLKNLKMVNPYRPELGDVSLGQLFGRIGTNLKRYITNEIPDSMFPFFSENYQETNFTMWFWGFLLVIIGIYSLYSLGRTGLFLTFYIIATMGILLIWPDVWIGIRFLLPTVPVLLFLFVFGVWQLFTQLGEQTIKKGIPLPLLFILLIFYRPVIDQLREEGKQDYAPSYKNYFALAKYIRTNDPDAVVSCRKPALFYLYSKSYTTRYQYTEDDKELINNLAERQVDYVVLEQLGYSSTVLYLYPAIQKNPDKFEVVSHIKNPDTYLLKFKP